jgi:uncharacterized membrane protein YdfJ with MMPL/SSD domain
MSGSVYFVGLVLVVGVVLAFVASPVLLIPAVVLALGALFWVPIVALFGRGGGASGVPSTSEASYEPVAPPVERRG